MLKVTTDLIPIGHPNRPGTKLYSLDARIWHGTANTNPGATDTMHRGYAGRAYVKKWNQALGKYEFFEADGKTPFRYGATNVYIDKDSATIIIPLDEYVPGAGDRPNDYNNGFKGQTKIARDVFNYQQNYRAVQFELCMNDMSAWDKVLENAIEFVCTYLPRTDIADYRHFDVTGKMCPSPMVDNSPNPCPAWVAFKERLRKALVTPKVSPEVPIVKVNGEIINNKMDVQPFIKEGRVFVPVRFITEALGKKVIWIADEKIVDIR